MERLNHASVELAGMNLIEASAGTGKRIFTVGDGGFQKTA